jgi:hypothetical protein
MIIGHFVAVVVNDNLSDWRGPNPEEDANAGILALKKVEELKNHGIEAYAVEVIEREENGKLSVEVNKIQKIKE